MRENQSSSVRHDLLDCSSLWGSWPYKYGRPDHYASSHGRGPPVREGGSVNIRLAVIV